MIRLKLGAHPPHFYYEAEQKNPLRLLNAPINKLKIYRQVYYMDKVSLNVIGIWRHGFKEPIWILTNMEPMHRSCMASLLLVWLFMINA